MLETLERAVPKIRNCKPTNPVTLILIIIIMHMHVFHHFKGRNCTFLYQIRNKETATASQ